MVEWTQICYADTPSEDIQCKGGKKRVKNDPKYRISPHPCNTNVAHLNVYIFSQLNWDKHFLKGQY